MEDIQNGLAGDPGGLALLTELATADLVEEFAELGDAGQGGKDVLEARGMAARLEGVEVALWSTSTGPFAATGHFDLLDQYAKRVQNICTVTHKGEMAVLGIGAFLGLSAGDFWGSTKAARDSAAAGSTLLVTGGRVAAVSAWLEPFKFVGLALFFAGIGVALSAIIPRIELRAQAMATVIPLLKQRTQG